jgi:ABC-type branched-subunit amino acid transport system ATPase component
MRFGTITVLDNINIKVEEGSIHGIIGPNGSGKTTIFNVINGIYKPNAGKVIFNGEDITSLPSHVITKKGISRTFQLLRIFPSLTVLDNLMLSLAVKDKSNAFDAFFSTPKLHREEKRMREKAFEILKLIGLEKKAYNSAEGISIGQRRMLQLGMGIINEPKLLLLD